MAAPVYLPLDSGTGYVQHTEVRSIETTPARWGFQVERLTIEAPEHWGIRSLVIGGRELVGAEGTMPASAFAGHSPLFVGVECPKGATVKLEVENLSVMGLRLLGVVSGPRLED